MTTAKKPEGSLIGTFAKSGGYDVLTKLGEVTVDSFMNEGILRDIPIIGTIVGLGKAGVAVRDLLFVRKLQAFLGELDNASEERERFARDMESNPEERDRVGMQLMVLLERFEETKKASFLGKAFATYLRGIVTLSSFLRMSRAIDRCLVEDLVLVGSGNTLERVRDTAHLAADYQSCGFIEVAVLPQIPAAEARPFYRWTPFAQEFYAAVLKE